MLFSVRRKSPHIPFVSSDLLGRPICIDRWICSAQIAEPHSHSHDLSNHFYLLREPSGLEEIKNKTNEAVSYLVAALESGQSEVFTQYLNSMARFHHYSLGNIMLIARQRAVTCCYTSLESMNMRS